MRPCGCATCTATRTLRELGQALDSIVEQAAEQEGDVHFLRDSLAELVAEVEGSAAATWGPRASRRGGVGIKAALANAKAALAATAPARRRTA